MGVKQEQVHSKSMPVQVLSEVLFRSAFPFAEVLFSIKRNQWQSPGSEGPGTGE
jgi:hypothetical protein